MRYLKYCISLIFFCLSFGQFTNAQCSQWEKEFAPWLCNKPGPGFPGNPNPLPLPPITVTPRPEPPQMFPGTPGMPLPPPGAGPGASWPTNLVLNAPPGAPITNIKDYLKCINPNSSATVTIYVDQPTANSKDSWSGTPFSPNVGHTFVGITQGNITRLLGFYPANGVNPFTQPNDQSVLINDSKHGYDVSISVSVSATQMPDLIKAISTYSSTYNLNSYNCTDFGMTIAKAAGIDLPSSVGTWPGGGGNNPGALGQNIRNLKTSGPANKNTSGGTAPENSGSCN